MSGIHNYPNLNIPGEDPAQDAAQSEQNAATSGQVSGAGVPQFVPAGSAAPTRNVAGSQDSMSNSGTITQSQRNAIGGSLPQSFGPTLPAAPVPSPAPGYQSPYTQLQEMKTTATAVEPMLPGPQGEPSQAEMLNTLSHALNNEWKTSFEANRIAGMASVNAKQAEVKATLDEVEGERIHAGEQLGAAFAATGTQGLTALKGASLMGSAGSAKSEPTNKSALNNLENERKAVGAAESGSASAASTLGGDAATTRRAEVAEHRTQDAHHTEAVHARAEQNLQSRSSSESLASEHSKVESVNSMDESRTPIFKKSSSDERNFASDQHPIVAQKNEATEQSNRAGHHEEVADDVKSIKSAKKAKLSLNARAENLKSQESGVTKNTQELGSPSDSVLQKSTGEDITTHSRRRTMTGSEMRGEALKAASQGLGSVVQNSADLIDKMAGGQHQADEAKISQKQDQVNAQVAQNNQEMAKSNKEQSQDAIKNMYQAFVTAIQRKQDMLNQIAQR